MAVLATRAETPRPIVVSPSNPSESPVAAVPLEALTNIDGIIAKSQALMVARGDLGVELELERVPFAQKLLIRTGHAHSKKPPRAYAPAGCRIA